MVVIWVPKTERTQNNLSAPLLVTSRAGAMSFILTGLLSHHKVHCMSESAAAWEMDVDYAYVSLYTVTQTGPGTF